MSETIGVLSFRFEPDGRRRLLQADTRIEITDAVLAQGDPDFVRVGDGVVTFHCANADVSYGLTAYDDLRETWIGIRSDWTDEQDDA
jgi:hypothetical protein